MKITNLKSNFLVSLFIIPILFNVSCGNPTNKDSDGGNSSSYDNDLIEFKSMPLVDGQTVDQYFNGIAGIGGKVTWQDLETDVPNSKLYKVSATRYKSIHPTDVDVTFIYDHQTKNYGVPEALFHGHPQTLNNIDDCFRGLKLVMDSGWELTK